eukprot:ANDGO_03121.mRNA.2 Ribosomal RNA-processing protein 8
MLNVQYHQGFESQVRKWPENPLNRMVSRLKGMPQTLVVADLGCGTAQLALQVPQTVHSFDMVAANERIQVADMANVPLKSASVDVCVYCLSLMGTNVVDFITEARRILKVGGKVLVAEVSSRFENPRGFVKQIEDLGFKVLKQDLSGSFFFFFEFEKIAQRSSSLSSAEDVSIHLKPCLYKKR